MKDQSMTECLFLFIKGLTFNKTWVIFILMKFNKWILSFIVAFVFTFASTTMANQIAIYQNAYSSGNGGQFTGIYVSDVNNTLEPNTSFQTFCIDTTHSFYPGSVYHYTIGNQTYDGSGNNISLGTAYLYYSFINHTLPGYTFNGGTAQLNSAGLLQDVLWGLEGESSGNSLSYFNSSNPFYNDVLDHFGTIQAAQVDANGFYGVQVLNLYDDCGIGQSQLTINTRWNPPTVPENGTLLVSSFLLLIPIGFMARKRYA